MIRKIHLKNMLVDTNHNIKMTQNEKIKTSLCDNFGMFGSCSYGNMCKYAHGKEELRQRRNTQNRVVECRNPTYLKTGHCPYGNKCAFVHDEASTFSRGKMRQIRNHKKYKTKDCKHFLKNGKCPFKNQCAYLHINGPLTPKPKRMKNINENELLLMTNGNYEVYMSKVCPLASPVNVANVATVTDMSNLFNTLN